jgi:AcrR family transcriptional regulator
VHWVTVDGVGSVIRGEAGLYKNGNGVNLNRLTMKTPKASTRSDRLRQGSAERREAGRARLRDELLVVAERLLQENGYSGFSLRQVAEETGYTPTTIYRHFRDRDELLETVLHRWFAKFAAVLEAADREATDPRGRLMAQGTAYMRFAVEHPSVYRVMFLERMDIGVLPTGESFREDPAFGVLVRAVQALQDAGLTGRHDVMSAAMVIWSGIHGVAAMAVCSNMLADIGAERLGRMAGENTLTGLQYS